MSGNYFYRDEGTRVKEIICHLANHKEIYSEVIGYDYDSDFIVAAQKPIYEDHKTMIASNLQVRLKKFAANSERDLVQSEKDADSILKHDPYYRLIFAHKLNYWIISNKNDELYGPFTKREYENKRKELNVPESLQIDYQN